MSPEIVGLLGIAVLLILLAVRVPVAIAMFIVGLGGIAILRNPQVALTFLANDSFALASSADLVVIPLFILMGNVATETGLSRKLYDAAYAWIGQWRGGGWPRPPWWARAGSRRCRARRSPRR